MEFLYKNSLLPADTTHLLEINSAAVRLYSKLKEINVKSLNISDYNKDYFGKRLNTLHSALQKYSYLLALSTAGMNIPIKNCTILDYGGGSGILSLFVKEMKFGTVLYNDIYDISCQDAEIIGLSIGNQADHYILGDIEDVIIFIKKNNIKCNIVISDDVIEHIYDMENFIKKLPELTDNYYSTIVMSSGANSYNPFIVHKIKKLHYTAEFENKKDIFGRKKRDSIEAFYTIRKKIIQKYSPNLNLGEINEIAKKTRGLIEKDIITCVKDYEVSKNIPHEPGHPTNTCDPYTGNWAEHLMDIEQLMHQLEDTGFKSKILPGYYSNSDRRGKMMEKIMIPTLNRLINLPKCGICIAPFFTLYGRRCEKE